MESLSQSSLSHTLNLTWQYVQVQTVNSALRWYSSPSGLIFVLSKKINSVWSHISLTVSHCHLSSSNTTSTITLMESKTTCSNHPQPHIAFLISTRVVSPRSNRKEENCRRPQASWTRFSCKTTHLYNAEESWHWLQIIMRNACEQLNNSAPNTPYVWSCTNSRHFNHLERQQKLLCWFKTPNFHQNKSTQQLNSALGPLEGKIWGPFLWIQLCIKTVSLSRV